MGPRSTSITGLRHLVSTRTVSRPELADHLDRTFAIGASLAFETRRERKTPHLGRVELCTRHGDAFAAPLRSVLD